MAVWLCFMVLINEEVTKLVQSLFNTYDVILLGFQISFCELARISWEELDIFEKSDYLYFPSLCLELTRLLFAKLCSRSSQLGI